MPSAASVRLVLTFAVAFTLVSFVPPTAAQPPGTWGRERAPERLYRDFHAIPVSNGEPSRMISNDWAFAGFWVGDGFCGVPVWSSVLRGIEGTNGTREWSYDLLFWHKFPGPHCNRYWAPIRGSEWGSAWPNPYYGTTPIDNMQVTADVGTSDGPRLDGVADFLTYGWDRPYPCSLNTLCYDGHLDLRDGYTGDEMWDAPVAIAAQRYDDGTIFRLTDFPTGLYAFNSPVGARFVWKLTDATYNYNTGIWLFIEKIYYYATQDKSPIWADDAGNPSPAQLINVTGDPPPSTYITGAAQLDPSTPEYEIVYDTFAIPSQRDGSPPNRLHVGALQGDPAMPEVAPGVPGTDRSIWGPSNCYVAPQASNDVRQALSEEGAETADFHFARIIDDVGSAPGDEEEDRDEVVCTHRATNVGSQATSVNGRHMLHVQLVSGESGRLFWPQTDVKQQGYGFVDDLNEPPAYYFESWGSLPTLEEPDVSQPYLGVGTVDTRSPVSRGQRFPPKDTRLTTVKVEDGSPLWGTLSLPFAQNNYLALDWAVKQYATALAGHDYTGDGVRELVSAAKYDPPSDKEQTLLSTIHFAINVVDGKRGKILLDLEPWGPKGMVIRCPGDDPRDLTVLAGHARRIDITRFDATVGDTQWREPWYLNPRAQAQTAGIDTVYLGHRCADTPDARTAVMYSNGIRSYRRGFEVLPIHGFENTNGTAHWIRPDLPYKPPLNGSLEDFLDIREPPPSLKEQIGMSVLSVGGGVGAAFGSIALFHRRRVGVA